MMRRLFQLTLTAGLLFVAAVAQAVTWTPAQLRDKIKGGWAAQTIGVTYGGPTEFQYKGTLIPEHIPIKWYKGYLKETYERNPGLYDDIYCDLTFVEVFEKKGMGATMADFAEAFKNTQYRLWHANQQARANLVRGLSPRQAGMWQFNPCADDIDFQIEADFAGLMSPGMPLRANQICDTVGHIISTGDGYYGGVFVANMYAWAFVSNDVKTVVNNALKAIPPQSKFHQTIADVIAWHKKYPNDWKATWFEVLRKHDHDIADPKGIFNSFNIDARINAAYVVIGLLYGNGDFSRTLEIATRCGQDSDCNPSTAAGILGVIYGYDKIPAYWKQGLDEVEDLPFSHTTISLNKVYEMSYRHALANLQLAGAEISDKAITVKEVKWAQVPLEQNFPDLYPVYSSDRPANLSKETNYTYEFEFTGKGYIINGDFYHVTDNKDAEKRINLSFEITEDGVTRREDMSYARMIRPFVPLYRFDMANKAHKVKIRLITPDPDACYRLASHIVLSDKPVNAR